MTKLSLHELTNLKLLLSVDGIGPGKFRNLLSKFKSTEKILNSSYNSLLDAEGVSTNIAKRIVRVSDNYNLIRENTERELVKLQKLNASIITIWDKEFPAILKNIYDPPLLIYVLGKIEKIDELSVAIVGTRQPTNYGKLQAERIASEISLQGITVVSGLARGIDSIAHEAAVKNKGRTIAIIGSGLDVIYPPENKKLFEAISKEGAVISEFELGAQPDAANFPKRNRLIAGLSLGVIVIETGAAGGAMQTASLALDQNKEVFAVPGNLGVRQSEGTNLLIQKGEAKLVRSAEDVLVELELKLKPIIGKNIPKPKIDLNLFEEKIINALDTEALHIDKIASATNISTSDCLVHLLSLEFKGMIKQLPGKVFALL